MESPTAIEPTSTLSAKSVLRPAFCKRAKRRLILSATVMSLSRLWQQQDKRAEAYELRVPIYGWFTEGFDTADLQEAKALLETLS